MYKLGQPLLFYLHPAGPCCSCTCSCKAGFAQLISYIMLTRGWGGPPPPVSIPAPGDLVSVLRACDVAIKGIVVVVRPIAPWMYPAHYYQGSCYCMLSIRWTSLQAGRTAVLVRGHQHLVWLYRPHGLLTLTRAPAPTPTHPHPINQGWHRLQMLLLITPHRNLPSQHKTHISSIFRLHGAAVLEWIHIRRPLHALAPIARSMWCTGLGRDLQTATAWHTSVMYSRWIAILSLLATIQSSWCDTGTESRNFVFVAKMEVNCAFSVRTIMGIEHIYWERVIGIFNLMCCSHHWISYTQKYHKASTESVCIINLPIEKQPKC